MSYPLRKSTAGQVFQFLMVDSTTSLPKTGLSIASTDIKLIFEGGTTQTSKNSGGATEIGSTGTYYCTFDATDTATLGRLHIDIQKTGALPYFKDAEVHPALVWDALYASSGGAIMSDVQTVKTQAVTCAAGVTVGAFVGNATAALGVDASGRVDIGKALGTAITLDSNNVINVSAKYLAGTALTGRDIGLSVLLSNGTGTGQVKLASGYVAMTWADIAAPTTAVAFTNTTISSSQHVIVDSGTVTTLTNLPAITANWLTATGINAGALNGKGDWNIGKTNYALTSAYDPAKTAAQAGDAMALTSGERTTLTAVIWNALTSGMTTAGSIGKRIIDFLTGDIFARLGTPTGASVSADIANVATIADETDSVANNLQLVLVGPNGSVVSTTGTTTTLDAGVAATTNYHVGDVLEIYANTGAGQRQVITAYSSGRVATHAAWATNPNNGSLYRIISGKADVQTWLTVAPLALSSQKVQATATVDTSGFGAAVWDEAIAGHLTAGSTGAKLNSAAAAGDPLATPVPGNYGTNTAGYALGHLNQNIVISPLQASSVNPVPFRRDIRIYQNEARSLQFIANDATGTPVNLSGKSLRFTVFIDDGTTTSGVFKIETPAITIGTGSATNQATVPLGTNTANVRAVQYDFWNTTDSLVLSAGKFEVLPSQLNVP